MDTNLMRKNVMTSSGINIAAGVWLIAAPFVLGFADVPDGLWNHVLVGLAVLALAAIRATDPERNPWLSWINAALGVWLLASPFIMGLAGAILWNSVIVGILVAVMGLWSASASRSTQYPTAQV